MPSSLDINANLFLSHIQFSSISLIHRLFSFLLQKQNNHLLAPTTIFYLLLVHLLYLCLHIIFLFDFLVANRVWKKIYGLGKWIIMGGRRKSRRTNMFVTEHTLSLGWIWVMLTEKVVLGLSWRKNIILRSFKIYKWLNFCM